MFQEILTTFQIILQMLYFSFMLFSFLYLGLFPRLKLGTSFLMLEEDGKCLAEGVLYLLFDRCLRH